MSSPDGSTWTDITGGDGSPPPLGSAARASYLCARTIDGQDVLFLGVADQGLWRRANGAWHKAGLEGHRVFVIRQGPDQPHVLYAGVDAGGMLRSLSGGE